MSRKTVLTVCLVAVLVFLMVYEVISLYNTWRRPFLFLEIGLFFVVLLVLAIFRYDSDRHIWSFFEWMTRPREKPPAFSCVRCQSVRVIIHERLEQVFLHRHFWCKDCGYEWSNIEPKKQTDDKTT
jgi:hypothetical protein